MEESLADSRFLPVGLKVLSYGLMVIPIAWEGKCLAATTPGSGIKLTCTKHPGACPTGPLGLCEIRKSVSQKQGGNSLNVLCQKGVTVLS